MDKVGDALADPLRELAKRTAKSPVPTDLLGLAQPRRAPPDSPVQIRLLGTFKVLAHGESLPIQRNGKVAHLISRLALADHYMLPKTELLDALWPDKDPPLAAQSLNSTVAAIRRDLAKHLHDISPIRTESSCYLLNLAAGIDVDVLTFDALCSGAASLILSGDDRAAARQFEGAITLYGGELWADFTDPMLLIEQERLLATYLSALAWLSDYYLFKGDFSASLRAAHKLLAKDPCHEGGHRLVMRCHMRSGRRPLALRQYRLCRDILGRQYQAEPEGETVSLYHRILQGQLDILPPPALPEGAAKGCGDHGWVGFGRGPSAHDRIAP